MTWTSKIMPDDALPPDESLVGRMLADEREATPPTDDDTTPPEVPT